MKPGDQVDRYLLEAQLGRGGMGEVFEALDTRLARKVALKLLRSDADADGLANQRMLREARAAAAFEHPNAVVVFDVGEAFGSTFLAMELVRGKPLRRFVGDETVSTPRRLRWLADVARALAAAHRAGLVHRDVKPDNVMIRDDGVVKVLDFGIARRQSTSIDPSAPTESGAVATLTERGTVVGTPLYASPEQLRSDAIDGRSDQFSWAVMAHELLTGVTPWQRASDSVALLSQILSAEAPPLRAKAADVPEEIDRAIARALSKRATERFASMDDVAEVLEPFAEAVAALVPSGRNSIPADAARSATPAPTQAARIVRRTGKVAFWLLAGIGGAVVALLVVAGVTGHLQVDLPSKQGGAAAPLVVPALACRDAKLEGPGATPQLARAIGIGACARIATELGIDWGSSDAAHALDVSAKLAPGTADVTLAIGERRVSGKGATPFDAVVLMSPAFEKQVTAPPMTEAQVRAWGAKDSVAARRIERVWRKIVLNTSPDLIAATKALIASDPESPWPHAFAALTWLRGSDETEAARKKALELAPRLPPTRANGLRGILLYLGAEADRKEALALLRKAYSADPDDMDVAGVYAAIAINSSAEEGFAVLDRLVAKAATKSIIALQNAISAPSDRDLERDRRYLDKLEATLPETRAWYWSVRDLAQRGKIAEARAALAFGDTLGLTGKTADAMNLLEARIFVEFAALEPKAARALAQPMLGDPRIEISADGADYTITSYFLEGRVEDALSAELSEIERLRTMGNGRRATQLIVRQAAARRRLGRPSMDPATLAYAEKTIGESKELPVWAVLVLTAELAFARADLDPKKAKVELGRVLVDLEERAEKAAGADQRTLAGMRLQLMSLVRFVRGEADGAKLWREAARAPSSQRRAIAFQAGVALEKSGYREEAVAAYVIATEPARILGNAVTFVAGHARLAELYRAMDKADEAARAEAVVKKVWVNADPSLLAYMKDP